MSTSLIALASVLAISFTSLIGVFFLSLGKKRLESIVLYLVSFAAGALFGDVFLHILPEISEGLGLSMQASLYVLSGIVFSLFTEKIVHWRHAHVHGEHTHSIAAMNLFGDGVHNFIDGLIIGASYLVSIPVGFATTLAVFLHEIPQEIGDFGVLMHAGYTRRRALFMNFLLALTAVIGLGVALLIGAYSENLLSFLLPFAAGTFLYIAGSDLIPELHKEVSTKKALGQIIIFVLGVCVMLSLLFLE